MSVSEVEVEAREVKIAIGGDDLESPYDPVCMWYCVLGPLQVRGADLLIELTKEMV